MFLIVQSLLLAAVYIRVMLEQKKTVNWIQLYFSHIYSLN